MSFVEATMLLLLFECNRDLQRTGNVTIYKHVTSLKFTARLSVLQHKKAPSGGQHLFATHKPKYLRTRTKQSKKNSTKKAPNNQTKKPPKNPKNQNKQKTKTIEKRKKIQKITKQKTKQNMTSIITSTDEDQGTITPQYNCMNVCYVIFLLFFFVDCIWWYILVLFNRVGLLYFIPCHFVYRSQKKG